MALFYTRDHKISRLPFSFIQLESFPQFTNGKLA
jgi:hypothetical protein